MDRKGPWSKAKLSPRLSGVHTCMSELVIHMTQKSGLQLYLFCLLMISRAASSIGNTDFLSVTDFLPKEGVNLIFFGIFLGVLSVIFPNYIIWLKITIVSLEIQDN